jgi:hypothetical protein
MNRSLPFLASLMGAVLLSACGGSDNNPPAPPPPAAVAPQITTAPQPSSVGEGAMAAFGVTATGTETLAYQWQRDGAGPIAGATSASVNVGPVSLTDDGQRFAVTVSNAAGSVTSAEATLSVTERAWTHAALPPSGANGTSPGLAAAQPAAVIDSRGHTHMLFNQEQSNGYTMWVATKFAGQSQFAGFTRLTPPSASITYATQPQLAADGAGRVLAVWREANPDETQTLVAALYTPGAGSNDGSWGAMQAVSTAARSSVNEFSVAATASGVFDVLYEAYPSGAPAPRDVVARRLSVDGGSATWSAESVIDGAANESAVQPRLAGSGNGHLVAMWLEGSVRAAARVGTGDWSASVDVGGQPNEGLYLASVAIDAQGRGVAAMQGNETRVWARRFAFGANGFALLDGAAQYVHNYTHSYVPPVALAGVNGQPELISLHNNGRQISRVRFGATTWLTQDALHLVQTDQAVLDTIGSLRAAMDGAGNLMVTWSEATEPNSYPLLRARRHHAGLGQWRALADLLVTERVLWDHSLVMHADGRAQVALMQGSRALAEAVFR